MYTWLKLGVYELGSNTRSVICFALGFQISVKFSPTTNIKLRLVVVKE